VERRLWNPSLPQTLLIASFLLYANVVTALLFRSGNGGLFSVMVFSFLRSDGAAGAARNIGNLLAVAHIIGSVAAGYLISNERRVGWRLGVVVAAAPLVATVVVLVAGYPQRIGFFDLDLIRLLFDAALFALLLHPQSREHQRIWFT